MSPPGTMIWWPRHATGAGLRVSTTSRKSKADIRSRGAVRISELRAMTSAFLALPSGRSAAAGEHPAEVGVDRVKTLIAPVVGMTTPFGPTVPCHTHCG